MSKTSKKSQAPKSTLPGARVYYTTPRASSRDSRGQSPRERYTAASINRPSSASDAGSHAPANVGRLVPLFFSILDFRCWNAADAKRGGLYIDGASDAVVEEGVACFSKLGHTRAGFP